MGKTNPRWGLYPWFEEDGSELIHPDDLATVKRLMPHGLVFQLLGEGDGFIRLSYGDVVVRVRPSKFQEVIADVRTVGEAVRLVDGRAGEVIGVQWHHKRAEPMYKLCMEGKKKSKRYWNSDLVKP